MGLRWRRGMDRRRGRHQAGGSWLVGTQASFGTIGRSGGVVNLLDDCSGEGSAAGTSRLSPSGCRARRGSPDSTTSVSPLAERWADAAGVLHGRPLGWIA
jgi:hypothetical protein